MKVALNTENRDLLLQVLNYPSDHKLTISEVINMALRDLVKKICK